jgi:hypothetical protein
VSSCESAQNALKSGAENERFSGGKKSFLCPFLRGNNLTWRTEGTPDDRAHSTDALIKAIEVLERRRPTLVGKLISTAVGHPCDSHDVISLDALIVAINARAFEKS